MSATAGPFLRYGNCEPGSTTWRGSVLFLTQDGQSSATPAIKDAGEKTEQSDTFINARTNGSGPPPPSPTLSLDDGPAPAKSQGPIKPTLLESVLGWNFWRFDISLELTQVQRSVHYTVTPATGAGAVSATFWLPAAGAPFHWAYTSCNGISGDVPEDHYTRKNPTYLWRDMLQVHSAFPIHALVGGGDQVYSDPVWKESAFLKAWSNLESMEDKEATPWTQEAQAQATAFYLRNYLESFTQPDVSTAYASIPGVNVWDDHDIWDGFGSYDVELQQCAVFKGLFEVARHFYLLFQQHTTLQHVATSGDFLHHLEGYHSVRFMGPQTALLCIDMRTKRTKKEILPESTYQVLRSLMLDVPQGVEHMVVLSGVPLIFPNIPLSEQILVGFKTLITDSACVRACAKKAGAVDRFGQPEILDDLLDGWAAKIHKQERLEFIHLLQEVALAKKVRVSILSGDAHVGGVGRLYSRHFPRLDPRQDPLFMVQIISSAVMNSPPPRGVVDMLMRTNFASNVDERTRQKMVRAFWPTHPRTDKLLAQRNWCDVVLLVPPYAPPANPLDPHYGGLRFALRVEDPSEWRGYAEEVYEIVAPRAPGAGPVVVPPTGTGNGVTVTRV